MGAPQLLPQRGIEPSPSLFFETINAYQRTAALKTAIELDLFTAIAEDHRTAPAIARRCRASERGTRILCDYLVILGFLTKDSGAYGLTPDSAVFLDRRSPAYVGGAVSFLNSPALTDGFRDLTAIVKAGTTPAGQGTIEPENPVWVEFARAMAPLVQPAARWIAEYAAALPGPLQVLDIAAGHGLFGILIAARRPDARIVALDWPNVLQVARENAAAHGVTGRYRTLPGNAFEVDYGTGYDVVLLTNFLHHFDLPGCEALLRKVRAALKPGGCAITLEFVPNEDRVSPPNPASFSLMMLGTTPAGDAYTFREFDRMFRNAGFSHNQLHAVPQSEQMVIVSHA